MSKLKKITKNNRIDLMKKGFFKVGYMTAKEFNERLFDPKYLLEYVERIRYIWADMLKSSRGPINVVKVRSNDIYCSDECYYSYKGKSYFIDGILFHVYPHTEIVSVIKIKQ